MGARRQPPQHQVQTLSLTRRLSEFSYELDPAQIGQVPAEPRDSARMLVPGISEPHRHARDLPEFLHAGDVLVLNDTKVLPARLHLQKVTGGAVEVLLLEPTGDPECWFALVKPGKRLKAGADLLREGTTVARVEDVSQDGRRVIRLLAPDLMEAAGELPLPPYIHQSPDDPGRYQTVYANRPASVAAPTAGLHLTTSLLSEIEKRGVAVARVELEVGLGTFAPVTVEDLDEHVMHSERYAVSEAAWEQIQAANRVVAVGTTSVRTMESVAATGSLQGSTDIFIRPGYKWQVVDSLLTNFHMPKSTLLILLEAFIGPSWKSIYASALDAGYRVGSFGDCMLLDR